MPPALPDLSIRQLDYLVAVSTEPSWADAAARIGVSPSALSQGLSELERRMGVPLFDREGRRRTLRPTAEPVLAHARQVIALTSDLADWAERTRTGRAGELRVGMIDAAAVGHFTDVLRQFRDDHPELHLTLRVAPSGELLDEIEIGVFVQDASSYVGEAMSLEFQADLFRKHGPRVLFKPEASPLGPCISGLHELTNGEAAIFEGSGGQLLIDSHRRGVKGTIPGVEMLDGLVALWNACEAGDWDRAYEVYYPVCAIATLQIQGGLDGFIVSERYMLHRQGLFPNQVHRGPLAFHLDEGTRQEIDRLYDRLQVVLAA